MTHMPINSPTYWTEDGQLSEIGVSVCAEAIMANTFHQLPAELTNFLVENIEAKAQVLELCALLQSFPPAEINITTRPLNAARPMNQSQPTTLSPAIKYSIAAAITLFLLVGGAYYLGVFSPSGGDTNTNELMVENQLGGTTMPIPDTSLDQHGTISQQPADIANESTTAHPATTNAIADNRPAKPTAPQTPTNPKSSTTPAELNNDPFAPSEQHELYLLSSLRSSGIVARVQSPGLGQEYNGPVTFKWDVAKNNKPYTQSVQLEIRNNSNKVVIEKKLSGQANYTLENKLPKGLYYWFLSSEEESIYMGKFKVLQ